MKTIINFANKVRSLVDGRMSNIANVEESPSTHAYAVGKQLIFNGLLCRATSAIAVGDTLAVGNNLALSDNVVEQIYSLNQGLTNSLTNEIATRVKVSGHNIGKITKPSQTGLTGLDFTVNSDGSVTVNGTSTAAWSFIMNNAMLLKAGSYTLSSGIGANPNLYVQITNENQSASIASTANSAEKTFTLNVDTIVVYRLFYLSGQTFNNVVVKPMIRLATDESADYEPYAMTNREMTPYVQSISNPNLLDNPWFTVNQRGQNVYTSEGYMVDRWRLSYGTGATTHQATVNNDNSITIECEGTNNTYFSQKIENELLPGNDYTVSIKCRNIIGSPNFQIRYADGTYGITHIVTEPLYTYTMRNLSKSSTGIIFNIHPGESITLEAVKIEKGSVSTLAMDSAPNYQQELAKCQRYFQRIKSNSNGTQILQTIANSSTTSRGLIILSECMRETPIVTVSDIAAFSLFNSGSSKQLSSIALLTIDDNKKYCKLTISSTSATTMTANDVYALELANGAYIDFSADL